MNDASKLLTIYLQDHDAASEAGEALARRCATSNTENELGRYLHDEFIPQLRTERETVVEFLATVGSGPSSVKRAALRAGELVGRLKANGRIRSYSPLSRVIELEALIAGVQAKQRLWAAIDALHQPDQTNPLPDVTEHRDRAEAQLVELQRHHLDAVRLAFPTEPKDQ